MNLHNLRIVLWTLVAVAAIGATGDPDCDGDTSSRRIEGTIVGGTLDPDPVILP